MVGGRALTPGSGGVEVAAGRRPAFMVAPGRRKKNHQRRGFENRPIPQDILAGHRTDDRRRNPHRLGLKMWDREWHDRRPGATGQLASGAIPDGKNPHDFWEQGPRACALPQGVRAGWEPVA